MHDLFNIFSRVWMIDKAYADSIMPHILAYLQGQDISKVLAMLSPDNIAPYKNYHAALLPKSAVPVTVDYSSQELDAFSVAFYPMQGVIQSGKQYWGFSTEQFMNDFAASESNPNIIAHFIGASTPGGDAYMLDAAAKMMEQRTKPVVVHGKRMVASAGMYIAAASDEMYMENQFDIIGSIGTMVSALDFSGIWTKLGATEVMFAATDSDMKLKYHEEIKKGEYDNYRKQVLDPLNEAFIATVKNNFPKLDTKEEIGALRGATFFAKNDPGFTNGLLSRAEALNRAYELGRNNVMKSKIY